MSVEHDKLQKTPGDGDFSLFLEINRTQTEVVFTTAVVAADVVKAVFNDSGAVDVSVIGEQSLITECVS